MTRLDQLAQPIRRNGEHIRAVIERQKQHSTDSMNASVHSTLSHHNSPNTTKKSRSMSRSLTHLAGGTTTSTAKKFHAQRTLRKNDTSSKSMTHLVATTTQRGGRAKARPPIEHADSVSVTGVCFSHLTLPLSLSLYCGGSSKNMRVF